MWQALTLGIGDEFVSALGTALYTSLGVDIPVKGRGRRAYLHALPLSIVGKPVIRAPLLTRHREGIVVKIWDSWTCFYTPVR